MAVLAMACCGSLMAQQPKVADKEIVGVWLLESMQWEGEKKRMCGAASGYTQFKFYGADGEYACAEIYRQKDRTYVVSPHEYGTYTFKNGVYTEMGRSAKDGDVVLLDKNTYRGRWKDRHDIWKKQSNMPKKLVDYILMRCKVAQGAPDDMQKLIDQYMFK